MGSLGDELWELEKKRTSESSKKKVYIYIYIYMYSVCVYVYLLETSISVRTSTFFYISIPETKHDHASSLIPFHFILRSKARFHLLTAGTCKDASWNGWIGKRDKSLRPFDLVPAGASAVGGWHGIVVQFGENQQVYSIEYRMLIRVYGKQPTAYGRCCLCPTLFNTFKRMEHINRNWN